MPGSIKKSNSEDSGNGSKKEKGSFGSFPGMEVDVDNVLNEEPPLPTNSEVNIQALSLEELKIKREEAQEALGGIKKPQDDVSSYSYDDDETVVSPGEIEALKRKAIEQSKFYTEYLKDERRVQDRFVTDEELLKRGVVEVKPPGIPKIPPSISMPSIAKNLSPSIKKPISQKFSSEKPSSTQSISKEAPPSEIKKATPREENAKPLPESPKKMTFAQALIQQELMRRKIQTASPGNKIKQTVLLSISISLIILGIIFAFLFIFNTREEVSPLPEVATYTITPDDERKIFVTNTKSTTILSQVEEAVQSLPQGDGKLYALRFIQDNTVGESFFPITMLFNSLEVMPPERLGRSLENENYMIGVVNNVEQEIFLLFTLTAYENAVAAMFEWEGNNFAGIRNILIKKTSVEPFAEGLWQDAFIENVPVRIYAKDVLSPLIYYAFLDKETLLIAPGRASFSEAVRRFKALPQALNP